MAAPHTLLDAWPAALAIYSITRRTMLILCAGHEISLARVGIAQKSGYGLRLMLQKPVLQPSGGKGSQCHAREDRSEEHTSELQTLMRISYAVFCLKKKKK